MIDGTEEDQWRCLARVMVDPEFIVHFTSGRCEIIENPIPQDAQVRGAGYDGERQVLYLVLEHPSFPRVRLGERLFTLPSPVFRSIP